MEAVLPRSQSVSYKGVCEGQDAVGPSELLIYELLMVKGVYSSGRCQCVYFVVCVVVYCDGRALLTSCRRVTDVPAASLTVDAMLDLSPPSRPVPLSSSLTPPIPGEAKRVAIGTQSEVLYPPSHCQQKQKAWPGGLCREWCESIELREFEVLQPPFLSPPPPLAAIPTTPHERRARRRSWPSHLYVLCFERRNIGGLCDGAGPQC
ncbi:hypothetical protein BaRGS_00014771 [Batillaria attramentaria]|uniref:Uncharacterized protein n=1 Tax=Batillaria attramentaria TaxID=370345 RepID=A0ABD0L2X1_9CAEN